ADLRAVLVHHLDAGDSSGGVGRADCEVTVRDTRFDRVSSGGTRGGRLRGPGRRILRTMLGAYQAAADQTGAYHSPPVLLLGVSISRSTVLRHPFVGEGEENDAATSTSSPPPVRNAYLGITSRRRFLRWSVFRGVYSWDPLWS